MNPSDAVNELAGRIGASQVHCLLCEGPCGPDHPAFGTAEYMARLDQIHGRTR